MTCANSTFFKVSQSCYEIHKKFRFSASFFVKFLIYSIWNQFLIFFSIPAIPYTVRISTGDKSEHETQASAFIVFIGTEAASEQIDLDLIGKEKFEAGSVETFSVESPDVGDIKKIEVRYLILITWAVLFSSEQ